MKLSDKRWSWLLAESHPSWVCGWKPLVLLHVLDDAGASHPSWVCGLKLGKSGNNKKIPQSHPSWVCGLKLCIFLNSMMRSFVTPFVGVWIETLPLCSQSKQGSVTPFVGVWIETRLKYMFHLLPIVTPFVGVWIETSCLGLPAHCIRSHTLRGCVD